MTITMARSVAFAVVCAIALPLQGQIVLNTVDFETQGVGYTTSVPEFTDGFGDYFTQTDGSTIGTFINYTSPQGTSYFAANDIDGEGGPNTASLFVSGVAIAGFNNLNVDFLLAEDDDGGNQDWDLDTGFEVFASIDGGAQTQIFGVSGTATNTEPQVDTNFDGTGDGAFITDTFANFGAAIAGTGSVLDLEFRFSVFNAGDEDLAIDNIVVTGNAVPEPTSAVVIAICGLMASRRRRV